jgi:aminopeptidase N
LSHDEIPPALSQLFGATHAWVVLPSAAADDLRQGYEQLAAQWQRHTALEVHWDRDLDALPRDRAVWLFGWENRWRSRLARAVQPYHVTLTPSQVDLGTTVFTRTAHTVVLTARHPNAPTQTLGWLATAHAAAIPGLSRKLPHYGTYSYLGFSGDEPTNIAKGQWPVLQSPMTVQLPQVDGQLAPVTRAKLPSQPPLATLPAAFSAKP